MDEPVLKKRKKKRNQVDHLSFKVCNKSSEGNGKMSDCVVDKWESCKNEVYQKLGFSAHGKIETLDEVVKRRKSKNPCEDE